MFLGGRWVRPHHEQGPEHPWEEPSFPHTLQGARVAQPEHQEGAGPRNSGEGELPRTRPAVAPARGPRPHYSRGGTDPLELKVELAETSACQGKQRLPRCSPSVHLERTGDGREPAGNLPHEPEPVEGAWDEDVVWGRPRDRKGLRLRGGGAKRGEGAEQNAQGSGGPGTESQGWEGHGSRCEGQ